jgi:hypothetical protein
MGQDFQVGGRAQVPSLPSLTVDNPLTGHEKGVYVACISYYCEVVDWFNSAATDLELNYALP